METVYYNLDARRVSVCDMASGDSSPQCRSYAVLRRVEEKRSGQCGKVLDMADYRSKYCDEPTFSALEGPTASGDMQSAQALACSRHTGFALDLFATLAILVMATVVVMGFLPFL